MSKSISHAGRRLRIVLGLLMAFGLPMQANGYAISSLGGTPTDGWDGAGLGAATINYYLGWSGAPSNDGLTFGSLTLAQVETELSNAMATWSAIADITFNYLGNASTSTAALAADPWGTVGNETLVIYSEAIDGAVGWNTVTAEAWGPPDIMGGTSYVYAGNIHIDPAENWLTSLADGALYSSVNGVDLETVFLHELGHSLGLGHDPLGVFATIGGPVMAQYANIALSTLGADDIDGIRQLYSFQGEDWSNGDPGTGCEIDCDPPTTVPEPGTLFLLGAGLIVLARFSRRKRTVAL